jgi:hypothetical protein
MDRPAVGVEEGALEADGATDRPADGVEDGAEMAIGRHYLEADGAMDRPAYGVEDGAQVVTGRHRPEADGADGSVQAVPKMGAAPARLPVRWCDHRGYHKFRKRGGKINSVTFM